MIICYFIKPNWSSSDLPALITQEGIQVRRICIIRTYKWHAVEKEPPDAFMLHFHLPWASFQMGHFSPQTVKEQLNQ